MFGGGADCTSKFAITSVGSGKYTTHAQGSDLQLAEQETLLGSWMNNSSYIWIISAARSARAAGRAGGGGSGGLKLEGEWEGGGAESKAGGEEKTARRARAKIGRQERERELEAKCIYI